MLADTHRREFAPNPGEVRAARHYAMDVVCGWGLDCEDVGLVTTELATNAVLHGRSTFTVTLRRDETHVVVQVADENPRLPMPVPTHSSSDLSGRGLGIVERLSTDWGIMPSASGKVVWAELECVAPDESPS